MLVATAAPQIPCVGPMLRCVTYVHNMFVLRSVSCACGVKTCLVSPIVLIFGHQQIPVSVMRRKAAEIGARLTSRE